MELWLTLLLSIGIPFLHLFVMGMFLGKYGFWAGADNDDPKGFLFFFWELFIIGWLGYQFVKKLQDNKVH